MSKFRVAKAKWAKTSVAKTKFSPLIIHVSTPLMAFKLED
jgi:hypothetical protein